LENAVWYPQQGPHGYGYGYSFGYGYLPPPPPPKKGNVDMILLLAIGLPMLLLAPSSAVYFVLTDRGTVTVRDSLETTGGDPAVRLDTGTAPPDVAPGQTPAGQPGVG
jgi:hypothetical protein